MRHGAAGRGVLTHWLRDMLKLLARVMLSGLIALWLQAAALAQDTMIRLATRAGVTTSYWWMPRDGAVATVMLFSGGDGGVGFKDGVPQSGNFLIRSRDAFAKASLNVALVGNPSDARQLTPAFRQSPEHLADVRATLEDIQKHSDVPVWLVGTSQGTLSAAANSVALGKLIAGLVLSSTVTGRQFGGSVPDINLAQIQVPVLVFQHKRDACWITPAYAAERLMDRLARAPIKKYMEVDGGTDPTGNPCKAHHYHGFIGMEAQAVEQITRWIKHPVN